MLVCPVYDCNRVVNGERKMKAKTRFDVVVLVAVTALLVWPLVQPSPAAESASTSVPRVVQASKGPTPGTDCFEVGDGTCIPQGIGASGTGFWKTAFFTVPDGRGTFAVDLGDGVAPDFSANVGCTKDATDTDGKCVSLIVCNRGSNLLAVTMPGSGPVLLTASGTPMECMTTKGSTSYVQGSFTIDNSTGCTANDDCGGADADVMVIAVDNG